MSVDPPENLPEEDPSKPTETPARRAPGSRGNAARQAERDVLAARLNRLIQLRGWSGSELARRAGIERNVVSTARQGKTFPSLVSLQAMARAFNVEVGDLTPVYAHAPSAARFGSFERIAPDPTVEGVSYTSTPEYPGFVHVKINKVFPVERALEIILLAEQNDAPTPDGK